MVPIHIQAEVFGAGDGAVDLFGDASVKRIGDVADGGAVR